MLIYAGIDEAGYGPMFGPLVVGRSVFAIDMQAPDRRFKPPTPDVFSLGQPPVDMWKRMSRAVCRTLAERKKGRLPVNDSKKLYTPSAGLHTLEKSVLAFAALAGHQPTNAGEWLASVGDSAHEQIGQLLWYAPGDENPWQALPSCCDRGELAVSRAMLSSIASKAGVSLLSVGASVVFEDRFNQMASATRSKASLSFTFVARHIAGVWDEHGSLNPCVVVDRQSGRMHYRELLSQAFPQATVAILNEDEGLSVYAIRSQVDDRAMTVCFRTQAEELHLPVALASMVSKYTRELMMHRFQGWFAARLPEIAPTAGYGRDASRFWTEVQPHLAGLAIDPNVIKRSC